MREVISAKKTNKTTHRKKKEKKKKKKRKAQVEHSPQILASEDTAITTTVSVRQVMWTTPVVLVSADYILITRSVLLNAESDCGVVYVCIDSVLFLSVLIVRMR